MSRKPAQVLLLSVRPRFMDAILAGDKHVELRRRPPRSLETRVALLYASSPVCALVGVCLIDGLIEAAPTRLWREVGGVSGVSRVMFTEYFSELAVASALLLGHRWRFREPISLAELRASWKGFQPPQSFRYLSASLEREGLRVGLDPDAQSILLPQVVARHSASRPYRQANQSKLGSVAVSFAAAHP